MKYLLPAVSIALLSYLLMATPAAAKQAVTPVPPLVTAAVSEMIAMFTNKDVKQQSTIIRERYADNAIFIDPLMKVKGHKDIALEFYSLIKLFSDVKYDQKDVQVTEGTREGVYQADVENHQRYILRREGFISKHLMPETVELNVTTKLEVAKDTGKILSHVEVWHDKHTFIPGFVKPVIGGSTALLFKMLGWGKDVDGSSAATGRPVTES